MTSSHIHLPKLKKKPRTSHALTKSSKTDSFLSQNELKQAKITKYSPEFNQLQYKWYKKARKSGFKDLERPAFNSAQELYNLQGQAMFDIAKQYKPETESYYRQWTCFLVHNQILTDDFGAQLGKTKRAALELYAEGVSYRAIIKKLNPRSGRRLNLFSLHKLITYWESRVLSWNKRDSRGLTYQSDL